MINGTVRSNDVMTLAYEHVEAPDGIMAIFAGGVFWESCEQFERSCSENAEHALERVLELRVYDKTSEFHAVRDSIDADRKLSWRLVKDTDYEDYLDDVQYLDIDSARSEPEEGVYRTTGGGEYSLPLANAERLRIRNYLEYDRDGVAGIVDYRIVGLLKEGDDDA